MTQGNEERMSRLCLIKKKDWRLRNMNYIKRIFVWVLVTAVLVTGMDFSAVSAQAEEAPAAARAEADNGDLTVSGTNSFGQMLSTVLEQETDSKESCYITDLVMDGSNAVISYAAEYDCNLVAAVYTEDGAQMVASKTAQVSASEREVTVSFAGEELPDYYLIKAFLLDKERNMPLGKAYLKKKPCR